MQEGDEKNKGFFQESGEKIISKVEKTPMDKFFVFFLILISISAVVLGYMQFKKNIEGPAYSAYLDRRRGELMEKYNTAAITTEEQLAVSLKSQDSDLDGLDDWSEINVYATSPYLSDSDNDGISDKQEIVQGTNPNCPEGLNCSAITPTLTPEAQSNINGIIQDLGEADLQTVMQYEQDLISGKVTLSQLGIDNQPLQNLFDQLRNSEAASGTNLTADEKTQAIADLKKMTPAQLREELVSQGMDKAVLDQLDDQTISQMLEQIISTYQ
jgi:hypothetical protein